MTETPPRTDDLRELAEWLAGKPLLSRRIRNALYRLVPDIRMAEMAYLDPEAHAVISSLSARPLNE